MVCTVLAGDPGVADDTAPPAAPYNPTGMAGLRTVDAKKLPAWVKPIFGALAIADVITKIVAFCCAPLPVTLRPA